MQDLYCIQKKNINKYSNDDFYDKYVTSAQNLAENIKRSLRVDNVTGNYEIIMVHLPIESKKNLIAKIISTSQSKLKGMRGNI